MKVDERDGQWMRKWVVMMNLNQWTKISKSTRSVRFYVIVFSAVISDAWNFFLSVVIVNDAKPLFLSKQINNQSDNCKGS